MKKIAFISLIIILVLSLSFSDEMNIKSIDNILSDIRKKQELNDTEKINPDKVNQGLLEELGDAVMEEMIGDHDRHERMDQMMGGEGSPNLTAMHKRIGYNYLAGNITGYKNMMKYFGMMNEFPAKTTDNFKGGIPMMWNNGYGMMGGFGWIGYMIGIIILVIIGIAVFFGHQIIFKKQRQ